MDPANPKGTMMVDRMPRDGYAGKSREVHHGTAPLDIPKTFSQSQQYEMMNGEEISDQPKPCEPSKQPPVKPKRYEHQENHMDYHGPAKEVKTVKYQQYDAQSSQKMFENDDYGEDESLEHHQSGTYDTYEAEARATQHLPRGHQSGRSFHTPHSGSRFSSCRQAYGQPYLPDEYSTFPDFDEEDLDMFVPPYDEIPYALFLTNNVDEKTSRRAMEAQVQREQLKFYGSRSDDSTTSTNAAPKKVNKNKNLMLSKKKDDKQNNVSKEGDNKLTSDSSNMLKGSIEQVNDCRVSNVGEAIDNDRAKTNQQRKPFDGMMQVDNKTKVEIPTPTHLPSPTPGQLPSPTPRHFPSPTPGQLPSTTPGQLPSTTPGQLPPPTPGQLPSTGPHLHGNQREPLEEPLSPVEDLTVKDCWTQSVTATNPEIHDTKIQNTGEEPGVPANQTGTPDIETETKQTPKLDEIEEMRQKRISKFQIETKIEPAAEQKVVKPKVGSASKFHSTVIQKEIKTKAGPVKSVAFKHAAYVNPDISDQSKDTYKKEIRHDKKTSSLSESLRNRNKEREKILTRDGGSSETMSKMERSAGGAKSSPERFAPPIQYVDAEDRSNGTKSSVVRSRLFEESKTTMKSSERNVNNAHLKHVNTTTKSAMVKPVEEPDDDTDDEDLPIPYAMRIANKSKQVKRRPMRLAHDSEHDGHDGAPCTACMSLLTSILGVSPPPPRSTTSSEFTTPEFSSLTGIGCGVAKTKTKNKNKNSPLAVAKSQPQDDFRESDIGERRPLTVLLIFDKLTDSDTKFGDVPELEDMDRPVPPSPKQLNRPKLAAPKPIDTVRAAVGNKNATKSAVPKSVITVPKPGSSVPKPATDMDDKNGGSPTMSEPAGTPAGRNVGLTLLIKPVADRRHRAFRSIRHAHLDNHLKCSDCGRPECSSQNMLLMKQMVQVAKGKGYEVRDVVPDGNCMFAAVVDQLQLYGDNRFGPETLRESAVIWLVDHPCSDDGTHYSSFVEGSWETYLTRMATTGQWGDHIILRAVVEVVGCTVKILHTGGADTHWTTLAPDAADPARNDKMLILGHVGEFHYTSLRPTDSGIGSLTEAPPTPGTADSSCDDDGLMSLEGTESIDIFREDYIDEWSDVPVAHLSYILKRIIPIDCLNTAAMLQSQYCDDESLKEQHEGMPAEIQVTGSVSLGTFVPALRYKVSSQEVPVATVTCNMVMSMPRAVNRSYTNPRDMDYMLDDSLTHPGYTRLLATRDMGDGDSMTKYMPSKGFNEKTPKQAPLNAVGTSNSCVINQEFVPAFQCLVWPDAAVQWKTRVRRESWPTKQTVASIVESGCFVTPNAHPNSQQPDLEWQFSFALAEKKLFNEALSPNQKYCYVVFEALLCQISELVKLSEDHFRTVFLYACERIPADFWSSSPGSCLLYLLNELMRYLKEGNLPNYFIVSNNMVDHLSKAELSECSIQVEVLRVQPLLFLRQIHEAAALLNPLGNAILNDVSDDIPRFKSHRSVKQSTLEVFIPETIKMATMYIRMKQYRTGYELLSQAFEERLGVSTCDESLPYNIFLNDALSSLGMHNAVWFAAYADKHLEGQMPKSLIQDLYGEFPLVAIRDILPRDLTGGYGNTKIPRELTLNHFKFCNDFAKFLFISEKISAALPVLKYCHERYREHVASLQTVSATGSQQTNSGDLDDMLMLEVYAAMFNIYIKQKQEHRIRDVLPDIRLLHNRMNSRLSSLVLECMLGTLGEKEDADQLRAVYSALPYESRAMNQLTKLMQWPNTGQSYYTTYQ